MELTAIMTSIIFIAVLLSGPLSLFFLNFGFYKISGILAAIAISLGVYWIVVLPLPVSLAGLISVSLGIITFLKM